MAKIENLIADFFELARENANFDNLPDDNDGDHGMLGRKLGHPEA